MSIQRACHLRKTTTEEEVILWSELRRLKCQGLHFRRQVPRDGYFLDFACLRAKLIVEVDGNQHAQGRQAAHDTARDAHFKRLGFEVVRVWNADIRSDLDQVVTHIFRIAVNRLDPTPVLRADPPLTGEGKTS
jgi:very-short-patch-repair endonuclease